jgi:lipid-A-disaccharide synthase
MIRSLFLVAGELSSDRYAARLAAELRGRLPDLRIEAVGGPNLRAAGIPLFRDSSGWSAIGVAEAVRRLPSIWRGHRALKGRLKADPPDLLVLLDFGAFNVPTGNYARGLGIPVAYAIPPGSWRPDGGRVSPRLATCADAFLTPFQPSEGVLRGAGLDAHWLGHPLLDFISDPTESAGLKAALGLNGPTLAMLPGSRGQELASLAPVMLRAAALLGDRVDGLNLVLPLAPSLKRMGLEARLEDQEWKLVSGSGSHDSRPSEIGGGLSFRRYEGAVPLTVLDGKAVDALSLAAAAMVCSGTATLEAALVGCPMVIGYRGGGATSLEYLVRKAVVPKYIGLPNLLLDKPLCPELIQESCTPERLAEEVIPLLTGGAERTVQLEGFGRLRTRLGEPGVIARWADFIVNRWGGNRTGADFSRTIPTAEALPTAPNPRKDSP